MPAPETPPDLVPVLSEIARVAGETLDLNEVFHRIATAAGRVLTFDAMTVTLTDEIDGFVLYSIGGAEVTDEARRTYSRIVPRAEYSLGLWETLTSKGVIDDVAAVCDRAHSRDRELADSGVRAMLRAPLRAGPKTMGYLSLLSLRPRAFRAADLDLLAPIADVVAMAVAHARLAAGEQDRRRRYEALQALSPVLARALDVREVFDAISGIVRPVVPHDRIAIGLLNEDRTAVNVYAVSGEGFPEIRSPIRVSQEDLARVNDWSTEIVRDVESELPRDSDRCRHLAADGIRSFLRVPIFFEGQWQFAGGLLFLSRTPGTYGEDDIPLAQHVADQVALALSHERLAGEARRAADAVSEARKLEERVASLTEELASREGFGRIVGVARSWKGVLVQVSKVAPTETTVLLTGESGTGKEILARAIHRASSRASGPFVAINAAALPDQLLESELFGYERGAFTGATAAKPGRIEQAAGGTLFLDEAGEMSPAVQAKLLRLLQEREFQRLGGTKVLKTDARIVAATNRDLKKAIARGEFREDLFYRLSVFEIALPPLRGRVEDILPLTEVFLAELGPAIGRPVAGVSKEAKDLLLAYPWPGNVRELKNALERAAILCDGGLITAAHLPISVSGHEPSRPQAPGTGTAPAFPPGGVDLESLEKGYVKEALVKARFNKSKAAKLLGLTRAQLYSRIEKYGLGGGEEDKEFS
ncbi:MAG TPA: sigma 54-interacting transcriptional regulator [Thermoanaerobaculia bacterium]|nr:sigma 54-interacting transcriptional regulator [Thermoanaerobaculia bacterium]